MKTVQEDISTLKGRTSEIEKTVKDIDDGLNFMHSGVENLKCKVESTEPRDKIPKGNYSITRCTIDAKTLRFIGIPDNEGVNEENTSETVYRFMERELNVECARHIEFERVHRIGAKKTRKFSADNRPFFKISLQRTSFQTSIGKEGTYRCQDLFGSSERDSRG